jgi:hypothetical protein
MMQLDTLLTILSLNILGLQLLLAKPNDLVMDDPIQTKELEPLPNEPKDFQPVEFKPINNHLTRGSVKGTNVPIHYYHDVHIEDNNVTIRNDQNGTFNEALIDVYILKVYNPKGHIYSQPQGRYQLKQYKEPQQPLLWFFVLIYFFILSEAMNESALKKLKQETREIELF